MKENGQKINNMEMEQKLGLVYYKLTFYLFINLIYFNLDGAKYVGAYNMGVIKIN